MQMGNNSQVQEENSFCCKGFDEATGENYYFKSEDKNCGIDEGVVCAGSCPVRAEESECRKIQTQNKEGETIRETIKKRIRANLSPENCPENCECAGSVTKCQNAEGRELTIRAGKSGNMIIQSKRVNASTQVSLYLENGKYYGEFENNRTREIKIMPDVAAQRALERLRLRNCNESESCRIELKEVKQGNQTRAAYEIHAQKQARFLGIFKTRMQVQAQIDAENGEVIQTKKPWWAFLASEKDEEPENSE